MFYSLPYRSDVSLSVVVFIAFSLSNKFPLSLTLKPFPFSLSSLFALFYILLILPSKDIPGCPGLCFLDLVLHHLMQGMQSFKGAASGEGELETQ